jgi:hypothetical protein
MTWSPDSSTTGGAQTGFTDPTYTLVSDLAPAPNAKQHAVSALGGTQAGVTANSISSPFTVTLFKPASVKQLPAPNPVTGLRGAIPVNRWSLIIRKGMSAASGVPVTAIVRLQVDIPAGADSYSPAEIRGLMSFLVGILSEESADLGDTLISGVI